MPDAESPLVNEFKYDFIKRRLIETLIGGPKLPVCSRSTIGIHLAQVFLYLFPLFIGLIFFGLNGADILNVETCMYCIGGILICFTLFVQLLTCQSRLRSAVVAPVKTQKIQISDELSLETNSCCSNPTLQFVVPAKKYKLNVLFHAVLSGFMCAITFHYLSLSILTNLFSNVWTNYLLCFCGWLVICNAQYSLTTSAPPEPVVFHALDNFEVTSLMRPFYVMIFLIFHLISWCQPLLVTVDRSLHVVFAFLPLFWLMGILPPLDALFPWFGEQVLIYVFGGTAMASDLRLFVSLLMSITVVIAVYFIPSFLPCLILAAVSGYIFSLDLCKLWLQLLGFCKRKSHSDISKYSMDSEPMPVKSKSCIRTSNFTTTAIYLFVFSLAALVLTLSHLDRDNRQKDKLEDSCGYILLCLTAFNCVLSSVQQVYIVHGFFVNPIYPTDNSQPSAFHRRIKPLNFLGYLRIVLVFIGGPLLMISYLSIFISAKDLDVFSHEKVYKKIIFSITLVRAYRWIWQHTENALLEMTLIHYVNYFYPSLMAPYMSLTDELLIAAFIHNRLRQLWHKLHLVFIILVTSVSLLKQRRRFSGLIAVLNLIFLPVVTLIVLVTCFVSAPLLPLFTLPIFLVGFARPLRMWPGEFKKTLTLMGDTVYYKQLTPSLISNLQRAHLLGNLGHVLPGDFFLIHFEDRMIFVIILEKGFGYCTFGVKGLELQETSCHAVEATHLDMLITTAFDNDREQHSRRNPICMNSEPFHVFHPLATMFLVTYSDTRNVLTGLIDSPDTLKLISTSFVKTLLWVFLRHTANKYLDKTKEMESEPKNSTSLDVVQPLVPLNARPKSAGSLSKLPRAKRIESCLDEGSPLKSPREKTNKTSPKQTLQTTAGWSDEDDEDPLGDEPTRSDRQSVNVLPNLTDTNTNCSRPGTTTVLYATHLPGTINENGDQQLEFGLPAVDVSENNERKLATAFNRRTMTVIEGSTKYSDSGLKLAPPYEWLELPLDKVELNSLSDQFSQKWFRFVVKFICRQLKMDEKSENELESDDALLKGYRDLCLTCHAIINGLVVKNDTQQHLRPTHVYKTFNSEIIWSQHESWLLGNKELFSLAMKAYGYATKLALDQILMGESGTDEEIVEYLMEYDASWHIGSDANNAWEENVLLERPNLFSLGFNPIQRTFTSHLLTLQQLPVHVGRLNPEVVRGIWASLAFELLYLTNDDEERFSIQAHPIILRNLIVQAADPPLGYPIFMSGQISAGLSNLWSANAQ